MISENCIKELIENALTRTHSKITLHEIVNKFHEKNDKTN